MRYVGPYPAAAQPTYAALAQASTLGRREGLAALTDKVTAACAGHAAALPHVHGLVPAALTSAEKSTLIDGYERRSAKVKRLLERMRQSLPPEHLDLCPYCCLETTAQIDHYLPKARYPEFSLYGPNLLPICPVCNQSKGSAVANGAGQRLILMPSGDSAFAQRVLQASIVVGPAPHVTFSIDANAPVSPADLALAERHFHRLDLASRYRRRAHSLMAAIKKTVTSVGADRTLPQRRALARRAVNDGYAAAQVEEPANGWRLAFYEAIHTQRAAFVAWLAA